MELLTTAEAAARLDCDRTHLRRLVRQGKIAVHAYSPRVVLYDPAEIDRYKQQRRRGRPRKPAPKEDVDGA
jgi:excisionase family DNA binding protein